MLQLWRTLRAPPGLFRTVWMFTVIVLFQAFVAGISMETLSSVRAYVVGESLWSKAQADAVYSLSRYAETGEDNYYCRYQSAIAVPLGDRNARLALEQAVPDPKLAFQGLLQGGNHAEDIPGMIWLFRRFSETSYLAPAIQSWRDTDAVIQELVDTADSIHRDRQAGRVGPIWLASRRSQIDSISERATPLAVAFSERLGVGSRAIQTLLLIANLLTAALLILLGTWRARYLLIQRLGSELALKTEKERAEITLSSIGEAVISIDARSCVEYMNPAAERLMATDVDHARGRQVSSLFQIVSQARMHDKQQDGGEDSQATIAKVLEGNTSTPAGHPQLLIRRDGSSLPVSWGATPLQCNGRTAGAVLVLHDMTIEQEYLSRLAFQASHDALTGLANRREFERQLEMALPRVDPASRSHALMFLDLDQFKVVNDTCGHAAGDQLLRQVSGILEKHLREGDLVARLGGDEFAVLLQSSDAQRAVITAERLRQTVEELNFVWNGRAFNVTVSIGLVCLSGHETLVETLRAADVACYLAKEKGRNRVQLHHASDSDLMQRFGEMTWVQRIHEALDEDRFCLYAQKIMALQEAENQGLHIEVLIRLRDETGQLVAPGHFIPAAERYGLMPLIDRWVIRNAFAILAARLAGRTSTPIETCAIKLSGSTFRDKGFLDYVREQLDYFAIPPTIICFEITETSAIANLADAHRFIHTLQELGCRFSLDDFGSGMSSFAYLKHLPVNYLKIDGGFVKDMLVDRIDRAMVEMISHIGKVMGKRTIAEFVESQEILQALRELDVDYAQGYAIGKPEPFDIRADFVGARREARRDVA